MLYQDTQDVDEEQAKEVRDLELKYEKKYAQIYDERAKLLNGEMDIDSTLIEEFDSIKTKLHDEDYDKLEVEVCDVNTI